MQRLLVLLSFSTVFAPPVLLAGAAPQATPASAARPAITIPRLSTAPTLENFLDMRPEGTAASEMVKVTDFVQRNPHDGQPASQRTESYLGYDDKNLYAVFVCFDDPHKVRARMSRREDVFADDTVEIMLDTFHDKRRAYAFQATPLGVQWDAIDQQAHEDSTGTLVNFDSSFDTVWDARGKITGRGYVVWIAVPFKSLRFVPEELQEWGIILYRGIVRENEDDFWPPMSLSVEGRLGRAAQAKGLERIAPGRNIQLNPYGVLRSFRALDTRDPFDPFFASKQVEGRIGLDSKFILRDNLVLDLTANPDFSQVESDDPQITTNQRFEVLFPEKRPFFQENSDYFKTPIDLLFTRRIGDPSYGARLTGKVGPYSIGLLTADDRGPGASVPDSSPLSGDRAFFTIGRISRDVFGQSSLGLIYADWEFPGGNASNRVGGLDGRFKFTPNWTAAFQSVASSTHLEDGSYMAGPASFAEATYTSTHLTYDAVYNDVSPGFTTAAGFVNRTDIRAVGNSVAYTFRPTQGPLVSWGPVFDGSNVWSHDGTRLDSLYNSGLVVTLKGQTFFSLYPYSPFHERLRPSDFPTLTQDQDFYEHFGRVQFSTGILKQATISGLYQWGDSLNFVPAAGQPPAVQTSDTAHFEVLLRPVSALKIDNIYLFDRLRDVQSGGAVFNNHIIRSNWNWQFNRQLSLRVIMQYNAVLANPDFTALQTTKQFNADFLVTYLLHPGTAIYVGYNSDLQNLDRDLSVDPSSGNILRTRNNFINDGRQFFVKVSYLFRF